MKPRNFLETGRRQGSRAHTKAALREQGQSLVEMSLGSVFLLLVVLVLFESVMVFRSYIGVLNVAREGAFWVAHYPDMWFCDQVTCESATPDGDETY
jgi:Flp pilus assembly protein TadG